MTRMVWAGAAILLCMLAGRSQASAPAVQSSGTTEAVAMSPQAARALLDQYCVSCHNDRTLTANFSLETEDLAEVGAHADVWEPVIRKLRAGMMPPPGARRPPGAEYGALRDWLEAQVDRSATLNPGTKVLHRLNRTEYANAIRDLLGLEIDAAMFLPPDDSSRGFDNIAGSLTISPTLLETYVTAATKIARMAVGYWNTPTDALYIKRTDSSQNYQLEGMPFGTRGGMAVQHVFPADGEYKFTIRNLGVGTYIPNERFELSVDGEKVHEWVYTGMGAAAGMTSDGDGQLEVTLPVKAGSHLVGGTFVATNYRPSLDVAQHFERKSLENGRVRELTNYPIIGAIRIEGPFVATRPTDSASLRKVMKCVPATAEEEEPCAREILSTLARRAFRRPATPDDLESLMIFFEDGRQNGVFADGIELALRRLLASPQFLIRAEIEPEDVAPGEPYRITDLELASRLSFFLWSTIPDDELIDIAGQGRLSEPEVLSEQVHRMLADPRSESLVANFAQQWLYLRNLGTTAPAQTVFPDWDDELRESFRRETELLFESVMREDRSVLDMLTADYTFLNQRLANHYGIPNVYGSQFRRVELTDEFDYRRGVLGQGSFLSTTWVQNNRTSPVKRGVWVLENILGTPPPEPPPNVPALEETDATGPDRVLTLREQMTLHRSNPTCAACHRLMDPIGFALENFTADAQWRTHDGGDEGNPIDAAVELWDGRMVNGPVELREALLDYSPQFVRTVTEKMMTYALGRGVEYYDMPTIRSIVRAAEQNDNRFSSIVMGIVTSAPFQMRTKSSEGAAE
jgi:mono/diheme cytochrome c family protein